MFGEVGGKSPGRGGGAVHVPWALSSKPRDRTVRDIAHRADHKQPAGFDASPAASCSRPADQRCRCEHSRSRLRNPVLLRPIGKPLANSIQCPLDPADDQPDAAFQVFARRCRVRRPAARVAHNDNEWRSQDARGIFDAPHHERIDHIPAVRSTNMSPTPQSKSSSGLMRESEHVSTTANGLCPSAFIAMLTGPLPDRRRNPITKLLLPDWSVSRAISGEIELRLVGGNLGLLGYCAPGNPLSRYPSWSGLTVYIKPGAGMDSLQRRVLVPDGAIPPCLSPAPPAPFR